MAGEWNWTLDTEDGILDFQIDCLALIRCPSSLALDLLKHVIEPVLALQWGRYELGDRALVAGVWPDLEEPTLLEAFNCGSDNFFQASVQEWDLIIGIEILASHVQLFDQLLLLEHDIFATQLIDSH